MSDAKRFILDYRNDCDDCDYFDNQCHSCVTCDGSGSQLHTQQIIQKTVRVSSSEYMMNKATVVSSNNRYKKLVNGEAYTYNQSSDRWRMHTLALTTPRQSTRIAPGRLNPTGLHSDQLHNHYGRYLARKKQGVLRQQSNPGDALPVKGNKTQKLAIIKSCNMCFTNNV